MEQGPFSNSQVLYILRIDQRRLTYLAEKNLVLPLQDASGAGSRRVWSYTNVIELALCKELSHRQFGLHQIKALLSDLRDKGALRLWAEDFDSAFVEFAKQQKGWIERAKEETKTRAEIIAELKPSFPEGILFYSFSSTENVGRLIPLSLTQCFDLLPGVHWLLEHAIVSLVIDVGSLRKQLDEMIKTLP